jgi:hypothetical protein
MALIKLNALLTIRKQRWLTRQVAVENGVVVRTEGAGDGVPAGESTQPVAVSWPAGTARPVAAPPPGAHGVDMPTGPAPRVPAPPPPRVPVRPGPAPVAPAPRRPPAEPPVRRGRHQQPDEDKTEAIPVWVGRR